MKTTIPWLDSTASAFRNSGRQGRPPHAVLLLGAPGSGKRCAAAWMARERLGLPGSDPSPVFPLQRPEHADLNWIAPLEDKTTISIDQVRTLVADLALTSYEGRGKVAVIEPADAMTVNAANSLLKTLEEPPGDTLMILVADRVGRLPATIFSRCQHLKVALPPTGQSLAWLEKLRPGGRWAAALAAAGNAPLRALEEHDRLDEIELMQGDLRTLAEGRGEPLEVAARWAKDDPQRVLGWLARQVQHCVRQVAGVAGEGAERDFSQSVLERIDRRNLFCYLDIINRLRAQPAGSWNVQLTLECLLIDWAGGLETITD